MRAVWQSKSARRLAIATRRREFRRRCVSENVVRAHAHGMLLRRQVSTRRMPLLLSRHEELPTAHEVGAEAPLESDAQKSERFELPRALEPTNVDGIQA